MRLNLVAWALSRGQHTLLFELSYTLIRTDTGRFTKILLYSYAPRWSKDVQWIRRSCCLAQRLMSDQVPN